jgi:peptide/nickel transport system substrate-binding protein
MARSGGTLRVITPILFPSLDPALTKPAVRFYWYATCATLMAFRDQPAPAGFRIRPEAAVGPPKVSNGGRTYVFRVRRGWRFSDGSRLTAANFKKALDRVRNPVMASPGAGLFSDVSHVSAKGLRLRIDLNEADADLPMRLALPFACPVPLDFPVDPAGVDLTVGSGPYYIAQVVPDSMVVLAQNRYYRGSRPHKVDSIVARYTGDMNSDIKAVEDGQADVLQVDIPSELRAGLVRRFGVNKRQLFRLMYDEEALVLNTSRPLFKNNAALRKAVNYALDRAEIVRETPSGFLSRRPTDQILPSWVPGWRNYRIFPLKGPNLKRAHQLAQGNLRGGKAILWTFPVSVFAAQLPVIESDLGKIGLNVQAQVVAEDVGNARAGIPGAAYDIFFAEFRLSYPDPADALVRLLAGKNARKPSGNDNFAYFDEPAYDRQLAGAARLTGSARLRAFSRLDAAIMRNQAPWAPLAEDSVWLLVSKRVGCLRVHPVLVRDYPAMCLLS